MITVKEAQSRIISNKISLNIETIKVKDSLGRVTCKNIKSKVFNPPNDVSAMDGYALKFKDAIRIKSNPISIVGESSAGSPYKKNIKINQCIRISTGATIPNGLDCILLKEKVKETNGKIFYINQNIKKGEYIRKKGLNFKKNDLLIRKNHIITSRDIGIITSANYSNIKVYKKPIVSVLSTGNELRNAGKRISNSVIISSNSSTLGSLIKSAGGKFIDLGIAKDNKASLKLKILKSKGSDILLTSGGISVGEHDLVQSTLIELGMKVIFWKIAMRPGKPLMFGKLNNMLVLCFPGNPVSTFVGSIIFLLPLINSLLNINSQLPTIEAVLSRDLEKNDEREEYMRTKLSYSRNNEIIARPYLRQDSSMSYYLAKADGLIIRKPYDKALKAGKKVLVIPFSKICNTL